MEHADYLKAAAYWIDRDAAEPAAQHMDESSLHAAIDAFLAGHNTLALATCADGIPRCTPLEYSWHDGAIWIFSEGGRKFLGLEPLDLAASKPASGERLKSLNVNAKHTAFVPGVPVSCAIFESYAGFGKLASAQVSGLAEVVDADSPAFTAAAAAKGIPASRLPMLAKRLHLIKIVPTDVDFLDSDLKKQGFSSRQHLTLTDSSPSYKGLGVKESEGDKPEQASVGTR